MNAVLLQALASVERWAIHEPVLHRLVGIAKGGAGTRAEVEDALTREVGRMERVSAPPPPGVAIIPIHGIIEPRRSFWSEYFGGTSIEGLREQFRRALADETIKSIVFHVCSPGGDAVGVEEMGAEIYKARGQKPMISACDQRAASGAYWLAVQADECVGLQAAADCGSIGCYTMYENWQKWLNELGISIEIIRAGVNKAEGNPYEPLSDEARAFIQSQVDDIHNRFVAAVARGRGVTPAAVRKDFGQGRCFLVPQAVAIGMLDRQTTMDDVLARAMSGRVRRAVAVEGAPAPKVEEGEDSEQPQKMAPGKDGGCEDGYEMGDDGMCHLVAKKTDAASAEAEQLARQAQADRDLVAVTSLE